MLAALRSAVASVSSEMAEKNAVTRILAEHGHRRPPSVISQRDASGVTRVYLWADAGIALVTGPSLEGTVYEVRAVPADAEPTAFDLFIPGERGRSAFAAGGAKRASVNPRPAAPARPAARPAAPARPPLAQAPRRIGAAPAPQPPMRRRPPLTRRNPADPNPPPVSPLPAAGIGASFSTDTFKALPPNPVWAEGGGVDAIAARLKKTGEKPGGGLAGGVYTDPSVSPPQKYLVKFPPDAQMVGSEVLAAHLYRALGIYAPDMRRGIVDGMPAILSPWVDGLKKFATSAASWKANVPALEKKWLAASLPADVWLANYDVVGLEWDNLLALPDGHAIRIDPGASLMFRAGGQLKSPLPGTNAGVELDTMLFKPKGDKIQHVFADAAADPALMLPMAQAIAGYMKQGYINALAAWAGYTLKVGISPGFSLGDYLYERGVTLLTALLAKTGTAPAPQVVTSGGDADYEDDEDEEGFDLSALPQASSVTLLNALPEGSVVCNEDGDTLLHKDENGLWRELVESGMMLSGKFSGSAFNALGSPIYLLIKGDGEGLAPGDKAGLKALWKKAQAVLTGAAAAPTTALASAGEEPEPSLLADALVAALQETNVPAVKVGQTRVRVTKGGASANFDVAAYEESDEDGVPYSSVELTGHVVGKPATAASIVIFDYTTLADATTNMVFAAIGYLGKHGFAPSPVAAAPAAPAAPTPPAAGVTFDASKIAETLMTMLNKEAHKGIDADEPPPYYVEFDALGDLAITVEGATKPSAQFRIEEDLDDEGYVALFGRDLSKTPPAWVMLGKVDAHVLTDTMMAKEFFPFASKFLLLTLYGVGPTPVAAPAAPTTHPDIQEVAYALTDLLNAEAQKGVAAGGNAPYHATYSYFGAHDVAVYAAGKTAESVRFRIQEVVGEPTHLMLQGKEVKPSSFFDALAEEAKPTAGAMAKAFLPTALKFMQPILYGVEPTPTPVVAPVAPSVTPVPLGATPGFTPFAYSLPLDPVWGMVGDWYAFLLRIGKVPMGPQLGSFPGGKVTDPQTGTSFYIKAFTATEHAQTEALACRLYRILGLNAPDVRIINDGAMLGKHHKFTGKTLLISPWQNGYEQVPNGAWSLNEKEALATTFAADAWMANYDVVGKGPGTPYDNLLRGTAYPLTSPKHYLRVDQGAALDYRSTGSTKKSANDWGTNAGWTWKNFLSDAHPTIKKVFGLATYEYNDQAIARIMGLMLANNVINVFEEFGRDDLFDVMMERAKSLVSAAKKAGVTVSSPSIPTASFQPVAAPPAPPPLTQSGALAQQAAMLAALAIKALTTVKYTVEPSETGDTDFYVILYDAAGGEHHLLFGFTASPTGLTLYKGSQAIGSLPLNATDAKPIISDLLTYLTAQKSSTGLKQSPPQAAAPSLMPTPAQVTGAQQASSLATGLAAALTAMGYDVNPIDTAQGAVYVALYDAAGGQHTFAFHALPLKTGLTLYYGPQAIHAEPLYTGNADPFLQALLPTLVTAKAGGLTQKPPAASSSTVPTLVAKLATNIASALQYKGYNAIAQGDTVTATLYAFGGEGTAYPFKVSIGAGKLVLDAPTSLAVYGMTKVHEGPLNTTSALPFVEAMVKTLDATGKAMASSAAAPPPQAAAPAAGPVAVGTLLTTGEAIHALPDFSVIGFGYQAPNGSYKARVFMRNHLGMWSGKTFGASTLGDVFATQDLLDFSAKGWAAVVLRVGDAGPDVAALLAPLVAAYNIDPTAAYYPLGA